MTIMELEKLRKELEKLNDSLRTTNSFLGRLSLLEEFQKIMMAIQTGMGSAKKT